MPILKKVGYVALVVSIFALSYVVTRYCTLNWGRGDNDHRYELIKSRYGSSNADDRKLYEEKARMTGILNSFEVVDSQDMPSVQEYLIEPGYSSAAGTFMRSERNNQARVDRGIEIFAHKKLMNINEKLEAREMKRINE